MKTVAERIAEMEAFQRELEAIDAEFDAEPDVDTLRSECAFFVDFDA